MSSLPLSVPICSLTFLSFSSLSLCFFVFGGNPDLRAPHLVSQCCMCFVSGICGIHAYIRHRLTAYVFEF